MNQDLVYQRLREISWRRALTKKEQAELHAWLAANPESRTEFDVEIALGKVLATTRDLPVSTNFTARVLDAIQSEEIDRAKTVATEESRWWRALLPRMAIATAVVVVLAISYRNSLVIKKTEMAEAARQISEARVIEDIGVMEDFEAIRTLDSATATVDENLLAMSDDLLALNQ